MQVNMRRDQRRIAQGKYSICWRDENGLSNSAEAQGVDLSNSGIRVMCTEEIAPGKEVFIEAPDGPPSGYGIVRHCTRLDGGYCFGIEFHDDAKGTVTSSPAASSIDYYEFLQISPKAEVATITRIYRFMASRFHPDNPETGDPEKFLLLNTAYEVLSDPQRRAEYDASIQSRQAEPNPIFELSVFVNGIEGEMNRRLGVLSVLYHRRRTSPRDPRLSLFDLEQRMAFPREYLDFTTWYLKSKKYITIEDNSDFALTALGVDYVESNAQSNPILGKLLKSGGRTATDSGAAPGRGAKPSEELYRLGPSTHDALAAPQEKQ